MRAAHELCVLRARPASVVIYENENTFLIANHPHAHHYVNCAVPQHILCVGGLL